MSRRFQSRTDALRGARALVAIATVAVGSILLRPGASPAEDPAAESAGSESSATEELPEDERRVLELDIETRPAVDLSEIPDTLEARFFDGRHDRRFVVWKLQDGAYLDVADLAALTGEGYVWDPEAYRGTVRIDSLEIAFTLDSPLFWSDGQVHQFPAGVRYHEDRLLLPYQVLETFLIPAFGARARWDGSEGRLALTSRPPWLEILEIGREGSRLGVTVGPRTGSRRVRWDPRGRLVVQVRGLTLPPAYESPAFHEPGIERVVVEPAAGGFDVALYLEPGWVGVQTRDFPEAGTFRVDLTSDLDDVEQGDYELLTSFLDPSADDPFRSAHRVLIELSDPTDYLDALADALARRLEENFRHDVVFVRDRKEAGRRRGRYGLPEMPPVPEGDCWIGLRLESYESPEASDILVVHPGPAPRFEEVASKVPVAGAPIVSPSGGQVLALPNASSRSPGQRMVPWGQVPRLYESASAQLGRILADHLKADLKFRPVRQLSRPARIFRGLAMPAVLIYPAVEGDRTGLRALSTPDEIESVARSLAFGIDEFLSARSRARR